MHKRKRKKRGCCSDVYKLFFVFGGEGKGERSWRHKINAKEMRWIIFV